MQQRNVWLILGALGTALFAATCAAPVQTGFLDRAIVVDGQRHRYQVYVPADYTRERSWPVILFLHGSGERGTDGLLETEVGLGTAIRRYADRYPAIVVFPQAAPETRWPGSMGKIAMKALAQTMREFHGDPERIYLTGLSMGGNGAWYLAYRHPEEFAALVVICGYLVPDSRFPTAEPVVPEGDGPPLPALARKLSHLPIWIFHGAADDVVPVEASREVVEALEDAGAPVKYTEFPGVGHGAWDAAYQSPDLPAWLFAQKRAAGK